MNKAFKYRIYPNKEQELLFKRTFGCVRFIYNHILTDKKRHYEQTGENITITPASYKKQHPFLKEVDSMALCNAQLNIQAAYSNFFKNPKTGFPKFHSKKHFHKSYTTNLIDNNIRLTDTHIRLPKAGFVRIKLHRHLPASHKIKSVTVSCTAAGKYFVSILTEYEAPDATHALDKNNAIGLDYSSPHFYVDNNDNIADMPHFYRIMQSRLAKEQRKLSHMIKGSRNYKKQRHRIALLHEKIRNQRDDWLHKQSTYLANKYDIICIEDLNMQNMSRGLHLGKSTYDNSFGAFRSMLEYKLLLQGKKLIMINKWFPSSKTCNNCGYIKHDLTLQARSWECPVCHSYIDRDRNAATNIRDEGIRQLE